MLNLVSFQEVFQTHFNTKVLSKFDYLGDTLLVEFINDTISFYLKNRKVSFLAKYGSTMGGAFNVMPVRDATIEIINMALRKTYSASTLDVYKQNILEWFQTKGFDFEQEPAPINPKTIDILANTIYARREELQKILTELVLEKSSDKILVDYNYSIEWVVSSNTSSKVAQPILVLELTLKVNQDENGAEYSGKSL